MLQYLLNLVQTQPRQSPAATTLMFVPSIVFNDRNDKDTVRRYVWDEQSERIQPRADAATAEETGTIRTLHVEDNAEIRSIVRYFLRKERYDVTFAETGDDALAQAARDRYDVIIMDVNLGDGMDGVETTRLIRKIKEYKDVPIIAVTANLSPNIREHCMEAGMDAFLPKPFQKEDLLNTIRHAMAKRQSA